MEIVCLNWEETIPIRHKVLWPNKPPSFCKVEGDESALHYGVKVGRKTVCVASVYVNSESARLRKFATLSEYQNRGIGTILLKRMLEDAKSLNVRKFWFDARESAIEFYSRFGFLAEGERFFKSDVPYLKMSINLQAQFHITSQGYSGQNTATRLALDSITLRAISPQLRNVITNRVIMKGKYSKLILEYCEKEGIVVPPGFMRHSASQLAVIRCDGEKPKLVAKTFFKLEDLKYYISQNLVGLARDEGGYFPATVIDFKENKSFKVSESSGLVQL